MFYVLCDLNFLKHFCLTSVSRRLTDDTRSLCFVLSAHVFSMFYCLTPRPRLYKGLLTDLASLNYLTLYFGQLFKPINRILTTWIAV